MRLWTLHPSNLDSKGLRGAWREALLAQKVYGTNLGYSKHSQLTRCNRQLIANILTEIWEEANSRGYNFNFEKIKLPYDPNMKVSVTSGQIDFEVKWLQDKLDKRAPGMVVKRKICKCFYEIPGGIEHWEKIGDN